eukprot:TRINITY_DN905_c0_g2_i1.p1 TRINITY_DN905_c0_g2~~TRINITY_DN905_c0_g2_i1.p1  ORF type:complete len:943 (-),score=224.10 TRINITY_DN905_c0_g2_i1:572-3400(-)
MQSIKIHICVFLLLLVNFFVLSYSTDDSSTFTQLYEEFLEENADKFDVFLNPPRHQDNIDTTTHDISKRGLEDVSPMTLHDTEFFQRYKRQQPALNLTQENKDDWYEFARRIGLPLSETSAPSSTFVYRCGASKLTGTIPTMVGRMTFIDAMIISLCDLTGTLPSEIGRINSLQLDNNKLSGTIPTEIGSYVAPPGAGYPPSVSLFVNQLSGTVPSELGRRLLVVLNSNNLTGTLPTDIGRTILSVGVSDLPLTGTIPTEMFLNTRAISAENTLFTGTLPNVIGRLMSTLVLSNGRLSGTIPPVFQNLTSLRTLVLSYNQFNEGTFPSVLLKLTRLRVLRLNGLRLSGTVPTELGMGSYDDLRIADNLFTGTLPSQIANIVNMQIFNISSNQLVVPNTIPWNVSCTVNFKYYMSNNLIKEMPMSLVAPQQCTTDTNSLLDLSSNQIDSLEVLGKLLWDRVPNRLGNLNLADNQITGTLPPTLPGFRVSTINLSRNKLSGTIPAIIDESAGTKLQNIFLSYNNFTGKVPRWATQWTTIVSFIASNNQLDTIGDEFFPPFSPRIIDVSSNKISSSISSIKGFNEQNVRRFEMLSFADNQIQGDLGSTFLRKKSALPLLLTNNRLSCVNLPLWCAGTSVYLTGTGQCFPCVSPCGDGLKWDNEQCDDGNSNDGDGCSSTCQIEDGYDCSDDTSPYTEDVIQRRPSNCSKRFPYAAVIAGVIVPVAVILLFVILVFYIRKLLKEKNDFIKQLQKKLQLQSSHTILEENLAFNEVIGEGNFGKVFLGTLSKTCQVAIKEVKADNKESLDQFVEEAKIAANIPPHPNIVQFLGVCISEKKKSIYLVTQFVMNKNLQLYLSSLTEPLPMNKKTELMSGICAGMYHLSKYNIIHNDLAARNILVEESVYRNAKQKFNYRLIGKVSDFGLARSSVSKKINQYQLACSVGST